MQTVRKIDITPSVLGTMNMYIMLLESGNAEGRELARKGAQDMARKLSSMLDKEMYKEKLTAKGLFKLLDEAGIEYKTVMPTFDNNNYTERPHIRIDLL